MSRADPHLLSLSTCDCFMLQKDHDIGLKTHEESRIEYYNGDAIILIRNPFKCIFHTRYYEYDYGLQIGGIAKGNNDSIAGRKNLFIENEGNKQKINSFSIISSQLLIIYFT